jgi:hypothetical protein
MRAKVSPSQSPALRQERESTFLVSGNTTTRAPQALQELFERITAGPFF